MKFTILFAITIISLICICPFSESFAGWQQQTSGMSGGGDIRAIARANEQIIYAGTNGFGLKKSINGGTTWLNVNNGLTSSYIFSLAIDPVNSQILYAGTADGGIFKSRNGGESWTASNSGLTNAVIRFIAIDPTNSQILYLATDGGVFKSTNGGENWSRSSTGLPNVSVVSIRALAIDPTNSRTLYAGTFGQGIYQSTDGGVNWHGIFTADGVFDSRYFYVRALIVDPTGLNLFAATNNGLVIRRKIADTYNINVGTGISSFVMSLALDPADSQILYAGSGGGGVYKSIDGGDSWNKVATGLPSYTIVNALAVGLTNSETLYAGTQDNGLYKSTDGGESWNNALTLPTVVPIAIDPTNSRILYSGADVGVFKSSNGGGSWSIMSSGLTTPRVNAFAIDPNNNQGIYAGTWGGGVFKSTDGGANWSASNIGMTNAYIRSLVIDSKRSQTIYAGTAAGIFKSIDSGRNWSAINSGLANTYVMTLAMDPADSKILYAGTTSGVFKSTDSGGSWVSTSNGLTASVVLWLVVDPNSSQTIYATTDGFGVFKSTNGGNNWGAINSGLMVSSVLARTWSLAIGTSNSQILYVGTDLDGVYKSTDGGMNWARVNAGLTNTNIRSVIIDPANSQTLYVGTYGGGVFKTTDGGGALQYDGVCGSSNGQPFTIAPTTDLCTSGSATTVTGTGPWTWSCNGINSSVNDNCSTVPAFSLTLTFAGTGGGSVNGDISCSSDSACSTKAFVTGANVNLLQSPNAQSTFSGWSGDCTNASGNCNLTMDSNKTVTATFTAAPKAIIGTTGYTSIQNAYNAAASGALIKLLEGAQSENITFGRNISVFLEGGYLSNYSGLSSDTSIDGKIQLRSGTVRMKRVKVQ